ncbi:MAG: hypothetical protein ACD_19C00182G0004 [uncultured bacterium]|nr:MAG: hypothetical protein ACD_19C00182G0004 [uncultured bacterium]
MKKKIITVLQSAKNFIVPKLVILDSKITTLIPNPRFKKILYICVGSLFGFVFLIIIIGIILSPFRKNDTSTGLILNKPNIVTSSSIPQAELSDVQKEILNLETQIKELRFPESILNIPVIEKDLTI